MTAASIARLREEYEAAESETTRAVLLHELGVLEERAGDESGAARDHLAAINAEPEFSEPLERLIAILQQRGSHKNLEKLLERLVEVADGAGERSRALVKRAIYVADLEGELDSARALLEQAVEERPDDATAWLALELVAGQLGDAVLGARCLSARAELCDSPAWRALLLLDLARLLRNAGDGEGALSSLQAALEQKGAATFLALEALEETARSLDRDDIVAQALEARATLIQTSIDDEGAANSLGVPRHARSAAHAADAWARAADAHRRRGDLEAAGSALSRASQLLPEEPAFARARMALTQASGDTAATAELAKAALAGGSKGTLAAALWMRVAEQAAESGDAAGALDAVTRALAEDPGCVPARALQLDLLSGGGDPPGLASALESTAEQVESDGAKARLFLAAADAWARLAGDTAGAKAALSQAGMYGAPPSIVARSSRLFAFVSGDATWYEEATRRLVAAGASEREQPSLWFELVRSRLGRGDLDAARAGLDSLAAVPGGGWLSHVLRAYALHLAGAEGTAAPDATALASLADTESDPDLSRALQLAAGLRAHAAGRLDEARSVLDALFAADAADLVVASAAAALARLQGDEHRVGEILAECALATDDSELVAATALEAGIAFWQAGDRQRAVECFSTASGSSEAGAGTLLSWALRAQDPESVEARRRALEAADATPELALERFGLESGSGGSATSAAEALAAAAEAVGSLGNAATLGRALWEADGDARASLQALDTLAALGGSAAAVARASEHVRRLADTPQGSAPDPVTLADSAARWSAADPSAAAALEWLAASMAMGDADGEVAARRALAERLGEGVAAELEASASIVAALSSIEAGPLLAPRAPAARLANFELSPPGCDPRRRAMAINNVEPTLGDDAAPLLRALAGWNELAAGDVPQAVESFRAVVEAFPDELIGWEGLRAAGEAAGDRTMVAEACAALGDAVADDAKGAELWEHAALILIDELDDVQRGEFALTRAVERDVSRFVAFDKLFRLVRARKDGERLLELVAARLEVAEDPAEIAKLFWERARVLRESGRREEALTALENVTMLEPDHVGALALSGEIYITTGKLAEAAENLGRLSTLAEAPTKQRLMSGVAAVDLFENKLGQPDKALAVLNRLYADGLSTLPVRERLARSAAKLGSWGDATAVLEQLMMERDSRDGRIEAARLAMAIHRDRLGTPEKALLAVEKLLQESPDDGEALDLVISGVFDAASARRLLDAGKDALVASLTAEPMDPERVDRLARMAAALDRPQIRQAALGALVALGEGSPEIDRELAILDQRVARVPHMAIDENQLPDLCDPEDRGALPMLMKTLAPTFSEALGPGLEALGVGKKNRVDARVGLPVRNEIAAWAGALGIGDFELYVGGRDEQGVYGVATETPAIVVGSAVAAPLSAAHRQAVARELFAIKRGTTILRHRDATDVAALVVASCRVAGVALASPHYAMLDEFTRVLTKETPRKVKKLLPELAQAVAQSGEQAEHWVRAATSSLDRLAAIAAGDVSHVLAGSAGRGQLGASMEAQQRTARLLSFVLSPRYLALREVLGMGVR